MLLLVVVGLVACYENPKRSHGGLKTSLIDQLIEDIRNDSLRFEKLKSSGFLESSGTGSNLK